MNTISTEVQVKRLESWLRLADPEFTSKGMVVDAKATIDLEEFRIMVEKGTVAWKDVPDDWLEDLRGNDETV